MSTSKKKNAYPYHHGDLAHSLKKNALVMIKKKGWSSFSLRTLAKKCGVSVAAVYRHYKSKEHLLATLAEEGLDELQRVMLNSKESKKLQQMGLAYIQFALLDPLRFHLTLASFIDKTKFPSLLKKHHQTYEIVKDEVKRCVENGIMVGDIDALTSTAWATVHGTALLLLEKHIPNNKTERDAMRIAEEITTIVGRGLTYNFAKISSELKK